MVPYSVPASTPRVKSLDPLRWTKKPKNDNSDPNPELTLQFTLYPDRPLARSEREEMVVFCKEMFGRGGIIPHTLNANLLADAIYSARQQSMLGSFTTASKRYSGSWFSPNSPEAQKISYRIGNDGFWFATEADRVIFYMHFTR